MRLRGSHGLIPERKEVNKHPVRTIHELAPNANNVFPRQHAPFPSGIIQRRAPRPSYIAGLSYMSFFSGLT